MDDPFGAPEIINVPERKRLRPRLTKAEKADGFTFNDLYELQDDAWIRKARGPERMMVKDLLTPRGMQQAHTARRLGTWRGNVILPATPYEIERRHVPAGEDGLALYKMAVSGYGIPSIKRLLTQRGWPTETNADKVRAAEMLQEELQGRRLSAEDLADVQPRHVEADMLDRSRLALRRGRAHDRVRAEMNAAAIASRQDVNSVALHVAGLEDPARVNKKRRSMKEIEKAFGGTAKRTRDLDERQEVVDTDGLTREESNLLRQYNGHSEQQLSALGKKKAENVARLRMQKSIAQRKRLRAGSWDPEAADAANEYNLLWGLPLVEPAPHQMDRLHVQSNLWLGNDEGSDLSMGLRTNSLSAEDEVVSGPRPRKRAKTQGLDAALFRRRALAEINTGRPVRAMHSATGIEEWIDGDNRDLVGAEFRFKSAGDEPNGSSVQDYIAHVNGV